MERTIKDRKTDLSFYKPDVLSYYLILLATTLELVFLVLMLSVMPINYLIGVFILVNIGFLLMLFTTALETKVYKRRASITAIVFGGYCLTRLVTVSNILNVSKNLVMIYIVCIAISGLMIGAGVTSFIKVKNQNQFKKDGKINTIQMSK